MGGDHHHGPPYKIPDWTKYKVQDAPQLLDVQEKLAKMGLKNPWLRNHVWRYDKKYFKSPTRSSLTLFFRGMPYGLALALLAAGYEKGWIPGIGGETGGHGHGHGTDTGHH